MVEPHFAWFFLSVDAARGDFCRGVGCAWHTRVDFLTRCLVSAPW